LLPVSEVILSKIHLRTQNTTWSLSSIASFLGITFVAPWLWVGYLCSSVLSAQNQNNWSATFYGWDFHHNCMLPE